jgi:hypothetical protein
MRIHGRLLMDDITKKVLRDFAEADRHRDDEGLIIPIPFRHTTIYLKRLNTGVWYLWLAGPAKVGGQRWGVTTERTYYEAIFQAGRQS